MDSLFTIIAIVLYFIAIATIVPSLVNNKGINRKPVFFSALGALIIHAWLLSDLILEGVGQNFSIINVASLTSFIVASVMTGIMLKNRIWVLLPVVYGFSIINISVATFVPSTVIRHLAHNPALLVHITLALFAYATLSIAALYAIQLAWLDNKLKNKKSLAINPNIPPLLMVERQLFKIILIGNTLLTGTLITGFLFIKDMFTSGEAHKGILSFVAWVIYTVLLWGHYRQGWRGKKVTWFTVAGAIILTLAYFGYRFVQEIILN